MTKMFGRQSSSSTKTILLKSPDSDRVREVVITEIVVPNSRNSVERLTQIDRMDTKNMSKPSRKRRLDHLSQEEKIMRKKLKNREAAQTSRDRKKARLEELELAVCRLQKQCDILCDKYESVSLERDSLKRELTAANEELWRCRVEGDLKVDLKGDLKVDAAVMTEGPAVSLSLSLPLPQGLTAAVPISVSPPLARRLPALANHRRNQFPYAQWSPFHLPHLQLVVLVIWQTWLMTSSTAGSATVTRLAHLISKSWNCSPILSSNRLWISRKQTTSCHAFQNPVETPWTPTDRPPPAPRLQTVCRRMHHHPPLLVH